MQPIRLDDVTDIPAAFLPRLEALEPLFRRHEYIDSVLDNRRARALRDDLEAHLRTVPIQGYHCTRELAPGYFRAHGLRLTDLPSHQPEFLERFGHLFSAEETADIQGAWARHFVGPAQTANRNGRIWFCLTVATARGSGTEDLFRHFGGEAVYMPLKRHPTITAKLGQIGQPVIVEVRLPAGAATSFSLAQPLLSAYHRAVRPDAHVSDATASIRQPVPSADVLAVMPV